MRGLRAPPRRGRHAASRSSSPTRCARATRPSRATSRGRCTAREDAVVEPRLALGALRDAPRRQRGPDRYRFHPGRRVVAARARARVIDSAGTRWEGDLVVVATGAAYDHLPGHRRRWRHGCGGCACRCSRRRRSARGSRRRWPTPTRCATTRPTRWRPSPCSGSQAAVAADAPPPAPAGPAPRRRADHRRHPRLRGAVRLRALRGPDRGVARPGQEDPRRGAPAGAAPLGGRVRPVHRRRRVPARGDRARGCGSSPAPVGAA